MTASTLKIETAAAKLNITIQYLPPHNHRASKAERAIQTWKGYFISIVHDRSRLPDGGLGSSGSTYAELPSTCSGGRHLTYCAVCVWAHFHGPVQFSQKTPIASRGTKVVVFESPDQRASWAPHGVDGPALRHYRCYKKVYVTQTKRTRVAETLSWYKCYHRRNEARVTESETPTMLPPWSNKASFALLWTWTRGAPNCATSPPCAAQRVLAGRRLPPCV
jgi:hypothetical protein